MSDTRYVSTALVAKALGVSVTTVKRWVDDDVLPAHRTAGGHRKLLLGDVLRLVHENNLPHVDLRLLSDGPANVAATEVGKVSDLLFSALKSADGVKIRSLLTKAYEGGIPIERLADEVIAPAMHRLGDEWECGRIGVHQEHQGSRLCLEALLEVKHRLEANADSERPLAVGGAPEHDHYLLASFLAEMVLLDCGWRVVNLGAHTPTSAFLQAMDDYQPRLLYLSVSYLVDGAAFVRDYRHLYAEAQKREIAVAIGGQALTESLRSQLPYTTYGDGLSHLASFARSLNPRPRTPRRGRPPRNDR